MPTIQNVTGEILFASGYVQRFSASFGFNSNPTTISLEIIPGMSGNSYDLARGAIPRISEEYLRPGSFRRISAESFDFAGIIKTWSENYGAQGQSYSVELVDPRIAFGNIPVIFDATNITSGNLYSLMNGLVYYSNPEAADVNSEGVGFSKIRTFISGSSVKILSKPFNFVFHSGFYNTGIIPNWYRISSKRSSLGDYLQQAASDLGFDYYAHIMPDTLNNTTGTIYIGMINRNNVGASISDLDTILDTYRSEGTLIQYKRGQELRNEPNDTLVIGDNLKEWYQPLTSNGKYTKTYWGRSLDGSALFHFSNPSPTNAIETALFNEFPSDADQRNDRGYGMVMLDHIQGTFAEAVLQYTRISYEKIQVQKSASSNTYPPSISRTVSTNEVTGYYPTQNMMRAALFNQESWEAVVCKETPLFAQIVLGFFLDQALLTPDASTTALYVPFLRAVDFNAVPDKLKDQVNLQVTNAGLFYSSGNQLSLNRAIYDATRQAAENHYGKTWIVDLPTSQWLSAGTYTSAGTYPEIEYSVISHAWTDKNGASTPSGIGNHVTLSDTINPNFRNDRGEVSAFVGIDTPNSFKFVHYVPGFTAQDWYLPISRSNQNPDQFLFDQGGDMCVPIEVEQYELAPNRGIITVKPTLEAELPIYGRYAPQDILPDVYLFTEEDKNYGHFLLTMGYTYSQMTTYKLLQRDDEKSAFGIAAPRPVDLPSTANQKGIYIPLVYNYRYYGPFVYSSGNSFNSLGVNVINDGSLSPGTYASLSAFYAAGQALAQKASPMDQIVSYADFGIAGYPRFNIGSTIGNANITSMSMEYGQNGLSTSYGLKTFILPKVYLGKVLSDKNAGIRLKPIQRESIIINDTDNMFTKAGDYGIINMKFDKKRIFGNTAALYVQF